MKKSSGEAMPDAPEVRKGREDDAYQSTGYARTNQAVGSKHRPTKENHTVHSGAEVV
ncbi:MAG: hypothetical protein ACOY4L_12350 [Pseudomonadota bacterium]